MKVRLGVPAYGGIQPQTVRALALTVQAFHLCGDVVELDMVTGGSVLPRVRNEILHRFWTAGEDVLVFLDSDMSWAPVDIVKLARSGKELACCNYRVKADEVKWVCFRDETVVDGEFVQVKFAGTGCMAISREAVEKLHDAYPQYRYIDGLTEEEIFALFDFELRPDDNGVMRYWGEDYTFSQRWRDIGGEIWMMYDATIDHIGTKVFTGNYHEYMMTRPGGKNEGMPYP